MKAQAENVATSAIRATLRMLRKELFSELTRGMLPYWRRHAVDKAHGGFVGLIDGDNVAQENAPKGAVLNARILWTFSAAYRALGDPALRAIADRAAEYFASFFIDPVHGGVYWMVDARGRPRDVRKHVYAQSFAIYGLSEHYRATGSERSLRGAIDTFGLVERHAHDALHGGYHEAFTRDWTRLDEIRLSSDEDGRARKSMNTHLHALEAWSMLHHVWPDTLLQDRLGGLIELFLDRIIDIDAGHVHEFFEKDWTARPGGFSYGHDIEASWLLLEAAGADGRAGLHERARHASIRLAEAVLDEAVDDGGGVYYRVTDGDIDTDMEWWVQAEAIVGFLNAYEETGRGAFLDAALDTWAFIRRHVVDNGHGEWHRRVSRDGFVRPGHERVGPWKCPYHNARACLEAIRRIDRICPE